MMQFPDNTAAHSTELVMAALRRADVLKPDEPDHPTHYNRAFSAVYEALGGEASPLIDRGARTGRHPSRGTLSWFTPTNPPHPPESDPLTELAKRDFNRRRR